MSSGSARFQARYDQVAPACDWVATAAARAGFDNDAVFQVQLACDEACTNIIEHAYAGQPGEVTVGYAFNGRDFTITIHDDGRPFDPQSIPAPFIPTEANQIDLLEVGGLGLHFMRKLMDEVRFLFTAAGNTLIMVKRLPPAP